MTHTMHPYLQEIDQSLTGENRERYLRCIHCGEVIGPTVPETTDHKCNSPVQVKVNLVNPSILSRMTNYALAYMEHVRTGRQECTFEEVLARFRCCSGCPLYNDATATCSECGCYVNLLTAQQGANKLSWCDTECPQKHFEKISR